MRARLILTCAAGLLILGCSSKESKLKDQFIEGCRSSGAPKAVCTCTYDKMINEMGVEKFAVSMDPLNPQSMELANQYAAKTMQLALQCQHEYATK